MEQDRPPNSKAKLTEVNSYLTCYLCKGYYIDATTIVECLHSFCRSCIIQYLQQDPFCPICDLMINMAKPQIKPDKTLQDIVYKLVPGLYASEMCRRRKFWAEHSEEAQKVACPEAKGLMTERIIFSPQDAISLSIEYTSDDETAWNHGQPNRMKSQQQPSPSPSVAATAAAAVVNVVAGTNTNNTNSNSNSNSSEPDPEIPLRRYLQCPAMLRVEHLKKFICNKYSVDNQQYHIDILYKRVPLPDHYTLMDIAYIYSWKRNEPMKFYFRITDIALAPERFDYFEPSSLVSSTPKQPIKSRCHQPRSTKQQQQHLVNNHNNNNINNNTIVKKSSPIRADNDNNTISDNKSVIDNQIVNINAVENPKNIKNCDKMNKTVKCKTEKRKTTEKEVKQVKNECATDNKKKTSDNKSEIKLNNLVCSEKENIPDNNDKSDTHEKCKELSDTTDKQIKENSDKCETEKRVKEEVVFKIKSEPNYEFPSDANSEKCSGADTTKNDENISNNTKLNVPITIKSEIQTPNISVDKSTEKSLSPEKSLNKTENSFLGSSEEDVEKSNFFKSIQLTARSSLSPPNPNPTTSIPKIIPPILKLPVGQKRKYVRKNPKEPNAKKAKIENITKKTQVNDKSKVTEALTKMRRIAPKATKTGSPTKETDVKVRSIKNPIVRMIVSNMNKQSTNLNKLVGQTNETERLKSLIDSCKLNIPSSLSITLTESPRNEDGTIVETKPAPIKPVQNYIEILKLPETNVPSALPENTGKTPDASELAKKVDTIEKLNQKMLDPGKNGFANMTKTQKQTFQTMFEEAIKRNESMKAQLYQIQNQAKNAEMAKKAANSIKSIIKKQQNNALDLSSKTSPTKDENGADSPITPNSSVVQNLYASTPTRPLKSPGPNTTPKTGNIATNGHISSTTNINANGKRNILEIAHQLSKRSKLESENSLLKVPNSSISPNSTTSRVCASPLPLPKSSPNNLNSVLKSPKKEATPTSPPKQIIINNNFSSGGSISIKDSPKKLTPPVPKLPIPRLPVQKVPTPKLTMPIRNNNGLLKFSNYTAKLANSSSSSNSNAAAVSSSQTSPKPNSTNVSPKIPETTSKSPSPSPKADTIHGLTPNQILEKYNITNLAQFNANLNHAQLAFQQALMVSHQLEMHRLHQQTNQKQWINNPNILAHYENYVKSLKQQNQMCGNASKN